MKRACLVLALLCCYLPLPFGRPGDLAAADRDLDAQLYRDIGPWVEMVEFNSVQHG